MLKDDMISTRGDECDKAGVGYEAFVKQARRCDKPTGSCLGNQPSALWRHDTVSTITYTPDSGRLRWAGYVARIEIRVLSKFEQVHLQEILSTSPPGGTLSRGSRV